MKSLNKRNLWKLSGAQPVMYPVGGEIAAVDREYFSQAFSLRDANE